MLRTLKLLWKEQTPREFFVWMPVCLGAGVGVYFLGLGTQIPIPFLGDYLSTKFLIFPLIAVVIGLVYNFFVSKNYFFYGLIFIIFGFVWMNLRVNMLDTPLLEKPMYKVNIEGTLFEILDKEKGQQWIIGDIKGEFPEAFERVKLTLRENFLSKNTFENIHVGDRMRATVDLFPLPSPIFPQSLDQRRKAYFEKISAQGFVTKFLSHTSVEPKGLRATLMKLRRHITEKIYAYIPGESGAIAAALITGERSKIPFATRQAFADAGIAHILAISGLHLSLIAGFIFFTVRGVLAAIPPVVERFSIKKWAAFLGIVFTFLYLLISGGGYPSIRAFTMTAIAMLAIMCDRRAISLRMLAIAAFLMILIYPESVISASFQLSFAAVTALIAFYEWGWRPLSFWAKDGGWSRKLLVYAAGVGLSSVIATIATTPFTMFLFNRLTMQALFGNLFAIPLTGLLLMPSALLSTLSLVWGGSPWMFEVFSLSVKLLIKIARWVQSFPGAAIFVPSLPLSFILLFSFGGLWICLWRGTFKWLGLPFVGAACLCFLWINPPDILLSAKGICMREKDVWTCSKNIGWFEKLMWQRHLGVREMNVWRNNTREITSSHKISGEDKKPLKIKLFADPKEKSWKEVKETCETSDVLITNGYVDRVCKNFKSVQELCKETSDGFFFMEHAHDFVDAHTPLLLSRTDLEGGTAALWLQPFKLYISKNCDSDKPWGTSLKKRKY